jgi:hypothetical protein
LGYPSRLSEGHYSGSPRCSQGAIRLNRPPSIDLENIHFNFIDLVICNGRSSNRLEAATKRGLCPKLSSIWRTADPVGRTSNRTGQTDHGSVARRRLGSILTELEILLLASRGFTSRPGKYADGRRPYLIVASATSPSP